MAGAKIKKNEKTAQKSGLSLFSLIKRVLFYVGKPFYLFFAGLTIFLLFIFYWTGRLTRKLLKSPLVFFRLIRRLSFPKPKLPRLKRPAVKLPKIRIGRGALVGIFFAFLIIFPYWYFILKDLPSPDDLITRSQEVSTKIYDRNGVLLYNIYKDKNRSIIPLSEVPLTERLATLAAEDAGFYSHPGFSVEGILRAFLKNVKEGELTGGSTITQQLVKNALLTPEKTIIRKVKELILSMRVERAFSKDTILEMYLNEVSYGGTAYGIEEASRVYFGKEASKLNLAEAAFLAGLPKSPTKYSPFGPTPEEGIARQRDVLRLMKINKFITEEQERIALNTRLSFAPNRADIKAPHFVMYVKTLLEDRYGPEVVEKGGLEVVTTLDFEIQKMAEKAVSNEVQKLTSLNVGNGAALVLDPKKGEVLAMVGSKDYFDTEKDGNVNLTTALRQPGSAIKIVNYAYALGNGFTPATIISDSPVTFSIPGSEPYSPKNYDNAFRGNITLRSALAESRNVPAVKVLASYGVSQMIKTGQLLGITTWNDPSRFGLSLTLGGGEVRLVDLAKVYATVANYGTALEVNPFIKVADYKGNLLIKNDCEKEAGFKKILKTSNNCEGENVLDPKIAFQLIDILKDNAARSPAFGRYSLLNIKGHPEVAVKTGTSNNLRDNLAIGFNQDFLVATWVGNNDNSPMARVASGITGATPIFNTIMANLLKEKEARAWSIPEGLASIPICTVTGTLTCTGCPTKNEWFIEGTEPTARCREGGITKLKEESSPQLLPEAASISR